jgi:hypothetical protein
MEKFLLASILVVPFLIARQAAAMRRSRAALVRVVVLGLGFQVFYVLAVAYLYFRLGS